MNTVKELELQLKEAKKQELKERWEAYLDKVKGICRLLVGQVLLKEGSAGTLGLVKITGYREQYYADVSGLRGERGPERWVELETEGYIQFRMRSGKYADCSPGVLDRIEDCSAHHFVFKKDSRIDIAKLDFSRLDINGSSLFTPHVIKFGHTEYEDYRVDPKYDRALANFMTGTKLMPDNSLYNQAVQLYLKQTQELKNFWLENSSKFKDLMPLDSLFNRE